MPLPTISVLMPAHNAEQYVVRSITSTLRALPRDAELLVKDDGSTDATRALVKGVRDRRIKLITEDVPAGVATSLNELASYASAPVLARMDADDITLPWRFRLGLTVAQKGGVGFSSALVFGTRLYRPRFVTGARSQLHFRRALLANNFLTHPTAIMSRRVFEDHAGYRPGPAEDYDLWLRLAAAGTPFQLQPIPTLLYRHHAQQVSRTSDLLEDRGLLRSWSTLFLQVYPQHAQRLEEGNYRSIQQLRLNLLRG